MQKTTVLLPPELRDLLKEVARRTGHPQAAVIREALRAYLRHEAQPKPSSIGAGADDEVTARDSEAWLHASLS